ncbi:MAG: type II secretion system F family protein [Desulfosoma sp.]
MPTPNVEVLPLVAAGAVFLFVILAYLGLSALAGARAERRRFIEKVKAGSGYEDEGDEGEAEMPSLMREQKGLGAAVARLGDVVAPSARMDTPTRRKFLQAGFRSETAVAVYWGMRVLLAVALCLGFLALRVAVFKLMPAAWTTVIAVLAALVGFYLPTLWLALRIAWRRERIHRGLPDALDLLVVCVEAGLGLDAALARVGDELALTNKVLSDEFKLYGLELRAGKPRREALRNLSLRTDLPDMKSLVTLLIQTDKFGTSVAQTLRVYADSIRTTRRQKAEEMAAKIPVKLVFPLILFILPALFVVLAGPAAISIFRALMHVAGGR